MVINDATLQFIHEHRTDDVRALALRARNHPQVDMPIALTQIAGWQQARDKVPAWAAVDGIVYPPHLSLEQCSSETTARYKAELLSSASMESLTDLTGGFGIDCSFLASHFRQVAYVERQEVLCEAARINFPLLGLEHIAVHRSDAVDYLRSMAPTDWIFIDPARRDGHGGKTVAIADCEPDVAALEEELLQKAPRVLVKLSPMLDLTLALHTLNHVTQAHIVSVNNDCKELLLLLERDAAVTPDDVPIHCVNLSVHKAERQVLTFTRATEKRLLATYTPEVQSYLYEPNVSVLKGGPYCTLCHRYPVAKLHPNSHLYTSDRYLPEFPGRRFAVTGCCGFNKKEVKALLGDAVKANLTVRNFPASVAELRKRLKLTEGGDTYLFATTLSDDRKILIACRNAADVNTSQSFVGNQK